MHAALSAGRTSGSAMTADLQARMESLKAALERTMERKSQLTDELHRAVEAEAEQSKASLKPSSPFSRSSPPKTSAKEIDDRKASLEKLMV